MSKKLTNVNHILKSPVAETCGGYNRIGQPLCLISFSLSLCKFLSFLIILLLKRNIFFVCLFVCFCLEGRWERRGESKMGEDGWWKEEEEVGRMGEGKAGQKGER